MSSDEPLDFNAQLSELQKRFGGMSKPGANGDEDEEPLNENVLGGGVSLAPTSRAKDRPLDEPVVRRRTAGRASGVVATATPSSPKRVDFLSDLSDGLLVESRRLAYENKQYKQKVKQLSAESEKYQNQASNLTLLNEKLSDKESKSGDRIWELETKLGDTQEKLDKASAELGKLGSENNTLKVKLGDVSTALESVRAEKMALAGDTKVQAGALVKQNDELRQRNHDLNDENDSLQKKVAEWKEKASSASIRPVSFKDALAGLGDASVDESDINDVSVLVEPESVKEVAGNSSALERETLQANLKRAMATISRLRAQLLRRAASEASKVSKASEAGEAADRSVDVSTAETPTKPAKKDVNKAVNKSVASVASVAASSAAAASPAFTSRTPKEHRTLKSVSKRLFSRKKTKEDDWAKFESTPVPQLESDGESVDSHAALADELAQMSKQTPGFESSPIKQQQQQKKKKEQRYGVIAIPKGQDVAQLGEYELVAMDESTLVKVKQMPRKDADLRVVQIDREESGESGEERLTRMKAQLAAKDRQLAEQTKRLAVLEKNVSSKTSRAEDLQRYVDDLKAKMTELQQEIERDEEEIAGLRTTLAASNERRAAEREKTAKKLAAAEKLAAEMTAQVEQPDEEYVRSKARSLGFVTVGAEDHEKMQASVRETEKLRDQVKSLEGERQALQAEVEAVRKERAGLVGEKTALAGQLKQVRGDYSSPSAEYLKEKAGALDYVVVPELEYSSSVSELQKTKQRLLASETTAGERQSQLEQLQAEVARVTKQAGEYQKKVSARDDATKELEGRIAQLQEQVGEKDARIAAVESEVVKKQAEVGRAEKALNAQTARVSALESAAAVAASTAGKGSAGVVKASAGVAKASAGIIGAGVGAVGAGVIGAVSASKSVSAGKSSPVKGNAGKSSAGGSALTRVFTHSTSKKQVKALEAELKQKSAALADARKRYSHPDAEYLKSAAASAGLVTLTTSEHAQMKSESSRLKAEVERKQQALEDSKQAHGQEAVMLKSLLEDKQKQLAQLKRTSTDTSTKLAELQTSLSSKDAQLKSKVSELAAAKAELQEKSSDLEVKSEALEKCSAALEKKSAEVEKLTREHAELRAQVDTLQAQADAQKKQLETPSESYLRERMGALGLVAVTQEKRKSLEMRADAKERAVDQLNIAITRLNTEYSTEKAARGRAQAQYAEAAQELGDVRGRLETADKENAANEKLLASKAARIKELNAQVDKQRTQIAGSVSVDSPGYKALIGALAGLGGEFQQYSVRLAQPDSADARAAAVGIRTVAERQAKFAQRARDTYESPSLEYIKDKATGLGLKVLTIGEYLNMKAGKRSKKEDSSDAASVVSEEAINEQEKKRAQRLQKRTQEMEQLQRRLQEKQESVARLQRRLEGSAGSGDEEDEADEAGANEDSAAGSADEAGAKEVSAGAAPAGVMSLAEISRVRRLLEIKREEAAQTEAAAADKTKGAVAMRHERRHLSIEEISAVDSQLDRKRRDLERQIASLERQSEGDVIPEEEDDDGSFVSAVSNAGDGNTTQLTQSTTVSIPVVGTASERREAIDAQIKSKKAALAVLERYIASNRQDAAKVGKTPEELEAEASQLEDEAASQRREAADLEKQVRAAVRGYAPVLATRKKQVAQLTTQLQEKSAEMRKLQEKQQDAEREKAAASQYVSRAAYDSLREEYDQQRAELTKMRVLAGNREATGAEAGSAGEVGAGAGSARAVGVNGVSAPANISAGNISAGNITAGSIGSVAGTVAGTMAGTGAHGTNVRAAITLPEAQSYASAHGMTMLPTARVRRLMEHSVTSQQLAAKAAEYDLALVPETELSQLKQRAPATAQEIEGAAAGLGMLCVPRDKFVATTVCREPDAANVVVVPTSYYAKLTHSHGWYRRYRDEIAAWTAEKHAAAAAAAGASDTDDLASVSSSSASSVSSRRHLLQMPRSQKSAGVNAGRTGAGRAGIVGAGAVGAGVAGSAAAARIPGSPPVNSPAYALTQLQNQAVDTASLHTVNTVITTRGDMLGAITQTIIGEYLFKYYRKLGPFASSLGETRHERYFWIHPYSLTLYWSTSNPSLCDPSENKIHALAIASVKSVPDNNPLPPGLYHKSILVGSDDGHTVKVTCPTRQRHNIWLNSLRYLISISHGTPEQLASDANSTVDTADDGYAENQYNENFSVDHKLELERSKSFRHQQPRSSVLNAGRLSRFSSVKSESRMSVIKRRFSRRANKD